MEDQNKERQFLFDIWKKVQNKEKLHPTEKTIAKIIEMHSEFDGILSQPEIYANHEFDIDEPDPFSHLGLHAIVMEMVSADSPNGIRSIYDQRVNESGEKHETQHELMLAVFDWLVANSQDEGDRSDEEQFLTKLRGDLNLPVVDS